jgi:hypothetical protein
MPLAIAGPAAYLLLLAPLVRRDQPSASQS